MVALTQSVYLYDQFGPVEPIIVNGPIHQSESKYGDGFYLDPASTNLCTDPRFGKTTTAWTTQTNAVSALSTLNYYVGNQSLLVTRFNSTAGNGGVQLGVAVTAGQTYAFSCFVNLANGSGQTVSITIPGQTVLSSKSAVLAVTGWKRIYATFTATSSATVQFTVNDGGSAILAANNAFFLDAIQIENISAFTNFLRPTSYFDGDSATPYNAAGALKTWNFEDGTIQNWNGYFGGGTSSYLPTPPSGITSAFLHSGSNALLIQNNGLQSFMRILPLSANTAAAIIAEGIPVKPGKIYSFTAWGVAKSNTAALTGVINFYDINGVSLNTYIGSYSPNGVVAGSILPKSHVRLFGTTSDVNQVDGRAPAGAAFAVPEIYWTSPIDSTQWWAFDDMRFEEGTGSVTSRWTGPAHNSTSVRPSGVLVFPVPYIGSTSVPQTHTCWHVVGSLGSPSNADNRTIISASAANATDSYFAIRMDKNGTISADMFLGFGTKTAGPSIADTNGTFSKPGALLFLAMTIAPTGDLTLYVAPDGGAMVSATVNNAAFLAQRMTAIGVGCNGTLYPPINNLYVPVMGTVSDINSYAAVLTLVELTAIAASPTEISFGDDLRIVNSVGTGSARGSSLSLNAAGVGLSRLVTTIPCLIENNPSNNIFSPDDDLARTKVTVAAGLGIGPGRLVTLLSAGGPTYVVTNVFSPDGGAYDELYVTPLTS